MDVILTKKPTKVNVLTGFPTFGVIGPIVSEYLVENLDCELIGEITSDKLQPLVALHQGRIVRAIEIYHNTKFNLVIVRSVQNMEGFERELGDAILSLCEKLQAWELISLEGIADQRQMVDTQLFGYANSADSIKKLTDQKVEILNEGIIMGLTASLLTQNDENQKHTIFFATSHSQLPDSKAAAKIIEALDKYLSMNIDVKPLLSQAQSYEAKLNQIQDSTKHMQKEVKLKKMSYVG